ncbi:galactose mutarotase [Streptomyces sodiiphilus]|uniref:Aldose 1-epimerase n=1 Tax=Streptomyces sodiiphilus TaxID=226217 RepID=A0ABN2PDI1_9ACTN
MREDFGRSADGTPVERYTLTAAGLRARVLTYGCVVQSLEVPDRHGGMDNVVIGLDSMEDYLTRSQFFGAVVGRFGNRVAGGRFTLEGRTFRLPVNDGPNSLHGGGTGFDRRVWSVQHAGPDRLVLALDSEDGDQGWPGNLRAEVTYAVTGTGHGGELRIGYRAVTDAPTHVNLTQHSYFNLAGAGSGDILGHLLALRADRYLPVDEHMIPAGPPAPTVGTPFDFSSPVPVGARIQEDHPQLRRAGGYDHTFVLPGPGPDGAPSPAAVVTEPGSGRVLRVDTTEPGVQFYSGNQLRDRVFGRGSGLCLETQHFPDSPNRPDFPSTVLRPGEEYTSTTVYRFSAGDDAGKEPLWP